MIEPVSSAVFAGQEVAGAGGSAGGGGFAKLLERTEAKTVTGGEGEGAQNSTLMRLFTDVEDGQKKVEEIMNLAMSGKSFSPQELLCLQAQAYRFSQELELTGKVVEKATSGVKETMRTNV